MAPLLLTFLLHGAQPITITSTTTVVRQAEAPAPSRPPPAVAGVGAALDRALMDCLSPRELARAAKGETSATHRVVLRVERERLDAELDGDAGAQFGAARFTEVSGLRFCGRDGRKALDVAAPEALHGAEIEHVVTFTIDRGFAQARLKSLDAEFRRICRPNGSIDETVLQRVASLPGTTTKGNFAEVLGIPAQFGLLLACGGEEQSRDLKQSASQEESHLEAIVEHVDVIQRVDLGACGASFARLRWQSRDGAVSALVIDHLPRTEAVERCLTERALGLELGAGAPGADWDAVVDHGVNTEPGLEVRVRGESMESHAALRARFAPLRASLASCGVFDDEGPLGRVTAVITRHEATVRGPQVGIESCVREAAEALRSAVPDSARFEVTFLVDDAARAERTAFLAPHRAFIARVCQAAEGASAGRDARVAALFREADRMQLDPSSASLVGAFLAVNPKERLRVVEQAAGEARVPCPALLKKPLPPWPPPSPSPSLQQRACEAFVAAARKGARDIATFQGAHEAEFGTYASIATLKQTSAMPEHFTVTTPRVGKTTFLARLEGTGPFAGEVWEVDEAVNPRRVKARPGACASTPVR